jgi:PPK2 family polyphosphate:nucleotide phosphotransferase
MATDAPLLDVAPYRVGPGEVVDLSRRDPGSTRGAADKASGRRRLRAVVDRLDELQRMLWAGQRHKVLVVLQAMDTGGKDGTIRKVFGRLNPQGVRVAGFKKPSTLELAHDYLWRVHRRTPGNGEIVVFNRSHYEDVLVVRVLDLVGEERWSRRFDHINDFERLLTDEGTTIVKFFLHISKEEQRRRLLSRLENPNKRWKFSAGDLDHRALWEDYTTAYEDVLCRTSTVHAPWYVVPADTKWYRDLAVASALLTTLEGLGLS